MTNKGTYATTYAQAFIDSYPESPAERSKHLIENAVRHITTLGVGSVIIDGAAFKLTSKRLGLKHTKKAIQEYLNA